MREQTPSAKADTVPIVDLRYDTVSFLSDYGLRDEFVGVVHSVIASLEPQARVIDVGHEIPRHDVRAGGLMLARSAQYLKMGVVLAVVDPGVGTDRRALAVEVGDGASVLVGPDNGLLAPAVAMVGGASRVVSLTNEEFHLPSPGPTFDGRDVFAPVAAHLCQGVPLDEFGEMVDPAGLVPGVLPVSELADGEISAEVLWIDTFGNIQINADPDEVASAFGDTVVLRSGGTERLAHRVRSFGDVPTGGVGLLVDSYGLLALVTNRSSAAAELDIHEGDELILVAPDEDGSAPPVSQAVPVALGRKASSPNTNSPIDPDSAHSAGSADSAGSSAGKSSGLDPETESEDHS